LEKRLKKINGMAQILRTQHADVPIDYVLGLGGYNHLRIAEDVSIPPPLPPPSSLGLSSQALLYSLLPVAEIQVWLCPPQLSDFDGRVRCNSEEQCGLVPAKAPVRDPGSAISLKISL